MFLISRSAVMERCFAGSPDVTKMGFIIKMHKTLIVLVYSVVSSHDLLVDELDDVFSIQEQLET